MIVVGAGIVGASAAYHLSTEGVEVVLVDDAVAGAATPAGAGIVGPWISRQARPGWPELAYPAAAYYPELLERLAVPDAATGWARTGALVLAADAGQADVLHRELTARAASWPQMGRVQRVSGEQAQRLVPVLAAAEAVHVEGVSRVDGQGVRDALRSAARAGGRLSERHVPAELMVQGERVTGVRLPDGTQLRADAVLVAAGAWSRAVCAPVADLPVHPQRGQIVHLQLDGDAGPCDPARWPVVQPPGPDYLLGFPGRRVVVGATRESAAGLRLEVTAGGLHAVLAAALATAPGLAGARHLQTRVGFRPATADGMPLLGVLAPGLVVATGLGATGLTMGPWAGAVAARLALGQAPGADLAGCDPRRLLGTPD